MRKTSALDVWRHLQSGGLLRVGDIGHIHKGRNGQIYFKADEVFLDSVRENKRPTANQLSLFSIGEKHV